MAEHEIYLSYKDDLPEGDRMAVLSMGSPALGDKHVVVLTFELVADFEHAKAWMTQMLIERPWEERN